MGETGKRVAGEVISTHLQSERERGRERERERFARDSETEREREHFHCYILCLVYECGLCAYVDYNIHLSRQPNIPSRKEKYAQVNKDDKKEQITEKKPRDKYSRNIFLRL